MGDKIKLMWKKFTDLKLIKQWSMLFTIILSPGFFIFAVAAGVALYFSVSYKTNIPFSNMMAIGGSIFGGVAGAFLKDEYDKISGKNILEKKGRSALRNLQAISKQLCNIETWIGQFSKQTRKQDKRTLEEINRHISTIELNITSGLEDWVDIVPELREKSQKEAEIIQKYKEAAESVMVELLQKRKELATTKDIKIEQELKKKIADLEKQIREIRKDRPQAISRVGLSSYRIMDNGISLAPNVYSDGSVVGLGFGHKKCLGCGKSFTPNYYSGILSVDSDYCDDCKKSFNS